MITVCATRLCRSVLILLLLCVLASSALIADAEFAPPWASSGTVANAVISQDGETVACVGAVVSKIAARNDPAYFVICDSWNSQTRTVVLSRPPLGLRNGQTVDVEGTIGTLPNGQRNIASPVVRGYFDILGNAVVRPPFFGSTLGLSKQILDVPTSAVPPSDPSMSDEGTGIPGEVSASTAHGVSRYDTVASLLASNPPVLSSVVLSAGPIVGGGDGYILVGDDDSGAAVKVYADCPIKPGARLLKLTATVHTEQGNLCLYAGSGVAPYYDAQGLDANGSVSVANPGTTAYTATLSDTHSTGAGLSLLRSSSLMAMAANTPEVDDGNWVYLTGQVVTSVGRYYSYEKSDHGWVNIYYVQGLDRTPGIRVWDPSGSSLQPGTIVDVMAELDTKDGERILGLTDPADANSVEPSVMDTSSRVLPPLCVMTNSAMCGGGLGSNLGVSGGVGLYNVGSLVKIYGHVTESGSYRLEESEQPRVPYFRIDDGSNVPSGNSIYGGPYLDHGVVVFDSDAPVSVGDCVMVTGASSIWKPHDSEESYRAIWTPNRIVNAGSIGSGGGTSGSGTISGTVTLYDMDPSVSSEEAHVYASNGSMQKVTAIRGTGNVGSASYSITGLPELDSGGQPIPYLVSAECDGYKTRTYTGVATGSTRNLHLTKLRKLYLTTDNTELSSCTGVNSTVITATVRNAEHEPLEDVTVRFRTNKGSFASDHTAHDYTPASQTDSAGQVTATLYAAPSEWGDAVVEATDDSAPLQGDASNDDGPYNYDWVQLQDSSGQPIDVTIRAPKLVLTANPSTICECEATQSTIIAYVSDCSGTGRDGVDVAFTTGAPGIFSNYSTSTTVTTSNGGYATVHLMCNGTSGTAVVNATAYPLGICTSGTVSVKLATDTLTLTADPVVGRVGASVTITANVKDVMNSNVSGRRVYFSWTGGDLTSPQSRYADTDASGNAIATITRSSPGKFTLTATEDMSCPAHIDVWFFDGSPDDWPMFMHDPQHTGMSKTWDVSGETLTRQWVVSLPTAATERTQGTWEVQVDQNTRVYHPNPAYPDHDYLGTYVFEHPYIDSSPVVMENRVVVGTWDSGDYLSATGSVKAFNAADNGATLWTATGNPTMGGVASTPCISNGKVYVGTTNGYLYCLDLSNGNQIWARQTTDRSSAPQSSRIISSPVVHNGVVYIANEASEIYAFTAADGALVTGYPIVLPIDQSGHGDYGDGVTDVKQQNICGASSPAIATVGENTYLLVGCDDGYLYRIKLSDRTIAELNMGGCVESSPSVSGDYAYIGVSIYHGYDLQRVTIENPTTGELEHSGYWQLGEESRATVSLAYDYAYNGLDTGYSFCKVDAITPPPDPPAQQWLERFDAIGGWSFNYFLGSAAHSTGGIVYTGNDNGIFYALSAQDLSQIAADMRYLNNGIICSSPAIGYNVDRGASHSRWLFVTTRAEGGRLEAFKTVRSD